ncbi:unnamed protein product [Scytosiphon promiscuus]
MDASEDRGCDTQDEENVALKPASIARIFELLRECCTAEQWGEWLSVPLEHAAAEGDMKLAEELVLVGAGGDPISAAIKRGQRDVVDHLLELDDDETVSVEDGHIELAVELEDEAFVNLLLSHGLPPQDDGALCLAVDLGNEGIVRALLKNGAKPDAGRHGFQWDRDYATPLLIAAKEGHAGIVRLLLDAGASPGRRLSIIQTGEDDICGFINKESVETESALDLAATGGHVDVIKEIVERDPSLVSSIAESTGNTALVYAIKHHQLDAFRTLAVVPWTDLEISDRDGNTALHIATTSCHFEVMLPELLRLGANVNCANLTGLSPLCLAVRRGNSVAADMLVSAGADVNKSLLYASPVSNWEHPMISTLLGYGADVNTRREDDGNTPLHLASQRIMSENVRILLEAGGDEGAANSAGETPVDVIGLGGTSFARYMPPADCIRALLMRAPRKRAWRRRVFLVLCRKFPRRVRLQFGAPKTTGCGRGSSALTVCHTPPTKKAFKDNEARHEGQSGSDETDGTSSAASSEGKAPCTFTAAMDRLLSLQGDEVFEKILRFL